jgi:cyclopropane fatty-acyl-phospholipid synthase-like methyltransferase
MAGFDTGKGPVVVDVHRYHEISEANHRILNPLTADHLLAIGDLCNLHTGQRHLDLACGKGEMLCQYAHRHGTTGVGVDIHSELVESARNRAAELGVAHAVQFVHGNASTYAAESGSFDIVSCIGATWIGGGLPGTLALMRPPLRQDGWLLVGELFWSEVPAAADERALVFGDEVVDLGTILTHFDDARLDLVEMVIANHDTWDRYTASQWLNVSTWLAEHPDDPEAAEVRRIRDDARRLYLEYERRYLGWGVFMLRPL